MPSPLQVSLAEPAQSRAAFDFSEAGASVNLVSGELLLSHSDHLVPGRGLPFSFDRSYRSSTLGYGPLGSAGWNVSVLAHLREIETTGEVEYHDGSGQVWRFYSLAGEDPPDGWEEDPLGSYHAPEGLFLRLQRLSGDQGWRLIDRNHNSLIFDAAGRLLEISDRHRRGQAADKQGSTLRLRYDAVGQLASIKDDLGRLYELEYFDDPLPEDQDGDGDRYGLLAKITDFVERTIEYEYGDDRTLEKVKLPGVKNPVDEYSGFSYEEQQRPVVEYRYDPLSGVTDTEEDTEAILHGDFAALRLEQYLLPEFLDDPGDVPRLRLEYTEETGRLAALSVPDRDNVNSSVGGVAWTFDYLATVPGAAPAKDVAVVEPWGHRRDFTLVDGRTTRVREQLEVTRPAPAPPGIELVERTLTYAGDGRLVSVLEPDGGRRVHCYPDGAGSEVIGGPEGCEATQGPDQEIDRLTLANVVKTILEATTQEGQGTADYTRISTTAGYQEDNLPATVSDGLGRAIDMAVPAANATDQTLFRAEGVRSRYEFDNYGRVKRFDGGQGADPVVRRDYHRDADGKLKAGLLAKIEVGEEGAAKYSFDLDYDDAYNVEEQRTSYGTFNRVTYDEWDRPVRSISGLSDGRFRQLGIEDCDEKEGAVVERAYDAAGHVVRERRLQDYVDAGNETRCRWVETRYSYNAREQLVGVEQTHLASPDQPGAVNPAPQQLLELVYDEFGRLAERRNLNFRDPALVMRVTYDDAGRISAFKVGDAGEEIQGYDEKSRVVRKTDGDQGIWRGRYDAWDRVYHQVQATGAVVLRRFDASHNPTEETTWRGDPLVSQDAELLARTRSHFTSFGQADRMVEVLAIDEDGAEELRVTERDFDDTGRLLQVLSGPPKPGLDELDRSRARREQQYLYELEGGRVLLESHGGASGDGPLYAHRYFYEPDNKAPWADRMDFLEAVPGEPDLVETSSTSYLRDALGRSVRERHSDGRLIDLAYDRTTDLVIQARTGAGTTSSVGFDGRGLKLREFRPNHRGVTTYAYDLDGRLRRQSATTGSGDSWDNVYTYDATGRLLRVDHEDGTAEIRTYNLDNTVTTWTTRDGVRVSYSYDPANRLVSAVPSAARPLAATLLALDAGDFNDYDELSRLTESRRGAALGGAVDPALRVAYSSYDLASRPASETVGSRQPLGWRYDTWSRRVELTLPAGVGRDANGAFTGFERQFDTLDRLSDIGGLGEISGTILGVSLDWGGRDRLYGCTTKGALGTAARYGYLAGRGPQPPGVGDDGAARWRLGTVTWGAEAAGATEPPTTVWGQLGLGWRGNDGDPRDGAKIGRLAVDGQAGGLDLFAGLGWSWSYDAGVRLQTAVSGRGDLEGEARGETVDSFRYEYSEGDELQRIIHASAGEITDFDAGAYGRVTGRDGIAYSYDEVGRRTEDDRFSYRWNWRGELITVTVKEPWPDGPDGEPEENPFAGHQIGYEYDSLGRLTKRWHLGRLPQGEVDDALRPFIEKRVYVWEDKGLLAEVGYNDPAETQVRWRKTFVPGAAGLDDAYQVAVDVVNLPGSPYTGTRLYTYLRDELGTVIGIVAEEEGSDPQQPPIPVRYLYTPYGEAHAETGPELRLVRFENQTTQVGTVDQEVVDPRVHASGALSIRLSAAVAEATLPAALVVEQLLPGVGWVEVVADLVVAVAEAESTEVLVMLQGGWERGSSYRVRVTSSLTDTAGRSFDGSESLEWSIPREDGPVVNPPVVFEQRGGADFESYRAAVNTVGGRFPGGQTHLFQGLWTDPTTGHAYARARWYDARSPSWLSEDPELDVDSPNLYAFVGWVPNTATDPLGTYVVKEQIVTPEQYLKELRAFELQLRREGRKRKVNVNAGEILEKELKRRKGGVTRKKGGRISDNRFVMIDGLPVDMKHFLQLAVLGKKHGAFKAKLGSFGEELVQATHKAEGARKSSMSPEDAPSNILGADFGGKRLDTGYFSLADQLEEEFARIEKKGEAKDLLEMAELPADPTTPEWEDAFDYDLSLTKKAPPQKKVEDFSWFDRLLVKKVMKHKEKNKKKKKP